MTLSDVTLHVSTLAKWNDCPRREAAKTIYKALRDMGYEFRSTRHGVGAAIGTGVHAGASHLLREKKEERTAPLKDVEEVAIVRYREATEDGAEYDTITGSGNDAEKQILSLSGAYYHGVAPHIIPVSIEEKMEAVARDITISGTPDVVTAAAIHDTKTSKSGETYHAQLGGYSLQWQAAGNPQLPDMVVDWLPRVSVKKPQPVPVSYTYPAALCEAEARAVMRTAHAQIEAFIETQEPGAFPCNTSSMLCSPKYCTGYGTDWCPVSKTFTE